MPILLISGHEIMHAVYENRVLWFLRFLALDVSFSLNVRVKRK